MVAEPVGYDYETSARLSRRFRPGNAILQLQVPNYAPNNVPPSDWQATLDAPQRVDLRRTFEALADEWHRDTGGMSSPYRIAMHWAYQRIIGMGDSIVSLIFEDMQRRGGQWYWALRAITGASPTLPEPNPTSRQVRDAWLQWGRLHGYIAPLVPV